LQKKKDYKKFKDFKSKKLKKNNEKKKAKFEKKQENVKKRSNEVKKIQKKYKRKREELVEEEKKQLKKLNTEKQKALDTIDEINDEYVQEVRTISAKKRVRDATQENLEDLERERKRLKVQLKIAQKQGKKRKAITIMQEDKRIEDTINRFKKPRTRSQTAVESTHLRSGTKVKKRKSTTELSGIRKKIKQTTATTVEIVTKEIEQAMEKAKQRMEKINLPTDVEEQQPPRKETDLSL
jgi:hypothetical protein